MTEDAVPWQVSVDRRKPEIPKIPAVQIDLNAKAIPEGYEMIMGKDGKPCVAVVAADGTLKHVEVNEHLYSQGRNTSLLDIINSINMTSLDLRNTGNFDEVAPVVVRKLFKPTVYLAGLHKKTS